MTTVKTYNFIRLFKVTLIIRLLVLLLLIALFFCQSLAAQTPTLQHYSVADGLPTSNIFAILEDKKGLIWLGTDKGLVRFDGYEFRVFDPININGSSEIWGLKEDHQGRIWCSTFHNILYFENDAFRTVAVAEVPCPMKIDHFSFPNENVGFCWGNEPNSLLKIDLRNNFLVSSIPLPEAVDIKKVTRLNFLKEEADGSFWFRIHLSEEILIFQYKETITKVFSTQKLSTEIGRTFYNPFFLNDNQVLFFSEKSAFLFDSKVLKKVSFTELFGEEFTLLKNYQVGDYCFFSTNVGFKYLDKNKQQRYDLAFLDGIEMNTLFEDRQKNIWIGTPYSGLFFISQQARTSVAFPIFAAQKNKKITALTLDKNQKIWLGTNEGHLLKQAEDFNFSVIKIHISGKGQQPTHRIKELFWDNESNLHLIYDSGILLVIPEKNLRKKELFLDSKPEILLENSKPVLNYFDQNGVNKIWGVGLGNTKSYKLIENHETLMSSSNGAYILSFGSDIPKIQKLDKNRTYASVFYKNKYWLGRKDGLFFKEPKQTSPAIKDNQFSNSIFGLAQSKFNKLWVAVEGKGVFRYNGESVDSILELSNSKTITRKIQTDEVGNLWAITNQGIAKVEVSNDVPFRYNFSQYSATEGLPEGEINQIFIQDSLIYAVTSETLTILNQQQEKFKNAPLPLIFTDFKINHQPVLPKQQQILAYNQNNISIQYAGLWFSNPSEIQYEYLMEGIDQNWQQTKETQINYSGIPPGKYVFRLKAHNHSMQAAEEVQMTIDILPPWWLSNWAYGFYCLLVLGLILLLTGLYVKQRLAEQKAQQAIELEAVKNRFFANITHEFRTPLTIILGSANQLKNKNIKEPAQAANRIQKQGNKLLNLINQVLDLAKLQSGKLDISPIQHNIIESIKSTVESFKDLAQSKNVALTFEVKNSNLVMDFYPKQLQTCLDNLLSNALKFTPAGGKVSVKIRVLNSNKILQITVTDSGKGMTKTELTQIFDRFYSGGNPQQSNIDSGTGIGLSLTKELTEKMGGSIHVESKIGKGSIFKISLPITQNVALGNSVLNKNPISKKVQLPAVENGILTNADKSNLPNLLIIEDNPDMFKFLNSILNINYQIQYAENGKKGIEMALKTIPDLILSDVVMPEKDGYELCESLKNNQFTSHIPIILLTANSQQKDKLKGLARGADAYLTKPFDEEELLIRLQNLYELRLKLHQRYANLKEETTPETAPKIFKLEDEFIINLRKFIVEHLDDPDLDVQRICREVAMSRTQLHRKMTALTGKSIGKFIKQIRLEKAEYLLRTTKLSITEIAFEIGYTPKQFSTTFKKKYSVAPATWRKTLDLETKQE